MKTNVLINTFLILCFIGLMSFQSPTKKEKQDSKVKTEKHKDHEHSDDENSHGHQRDKHVHEDGTEHSHHDVEKDHQNDSRGKGNAYGKNKMGLEGREFGQYRAQQVSEKLNQLERNYQDKKGLIERAEKRIAKARERLLELESDASTKEEKIAIARFKITRAEKHLNDLKFLMVRHGNYIKQQRTLLEAVYEE